MPQNGGGRGWSTGASGEREMPELWAELLEWLLLGSERSPRTQKEWAEGRDIHADSLRRIKRDPRFVREWDRRCAELNIHPERTQSVIDSLFRSAAVSYVGLDISQVLTDDHHCGRRVTLHSVAPVVLLGQVTTWYVTRHPNDCGNREAPAPRHPVVAICQQRQFVARLSRDAHLVIPSGLRSVSPGVELHLDGEGKTGVAANNVAQVTLTILLDVTLECEPVSAATKLIGEYLDDLSLSAHAL